MAQPDTTFVTVIRMALCVATLGCADAPTDGPSGPLVINEVMSNNDAAWVDEVGQVDDWIEIANSSARDVALADYGLRDARGRSYTFPSRVLRSGGIVVVFADGSPEQGELHADWKLSAEGTTLELFARANDKALDRVEVPALGLNEAYARLPSLRGDFSVCRYASPERDNGDHCGPLPAPELPDRSWPAFDWASAPAFQSSSGPLVLSELALLPAAFIEVMNIGATPVDLAAYRLQLDPTAPGRAWPTADSGVPLTWGDTHMLAPGARMAVPIADTDTATLAADPAFEGVVSLFDASGAAIDRVDFMRWPADAVLTRDEGALHRYRFCKHASPGQANSDCDPLASRDVGDRLRHLYTPGDYAALAAGDTNLGLRGVKFVVDMQSGDAVHLLSTRGWSLHYTFIRALIDQEPKLDRCDAMQASVFEQAWFAFSEREYFREQGRRYLLGTLDTYAGSGLRAFDFAVGDLIGAEQMHHAFLRVLGNMDSQNAHDWAVHPTEPRQEQALLQIPGKLPVVALNAPFRNLRYQPLTEGVAFGRLRFFSTDELEQAALGPDVIAVTEAVPNDIPFVGGLITEAFQTPLAHVNVLSQNRGTPNMALRDARHDPMLAPLLDGLVRYEVSSDGFSLRKASSEETAEFLASRAPTGPRVAPRIDLSVRALVDLSTRGLADLPSIGAKAAQLAELGHVVANGTSCQGPVPLPATAFAIPLVHYVEHFERSGAREMLETAQATAEFRGDPSVRGEVLSKLRAAIINTPVDPPLLAEIQALIEARFGTTRLRFRSSSNTEDLPGFNGAGLYESWSGALGDDDRPIEGAVRDVWASLWNTRAYDEREFGNIDQSGVAMGVLVHPAFLSERANVIVISRDVLDPTRSDIHYMNAQEGEASVANPAPGVSTEELLHHFRVIPNTPEVEYQSQSSLAHGRHVLTVDDAQRISCYVGAIHDHFQALLDPQHTDRWFAMDMEVKLVGDARAVVFKQARPYRFGRADRPADCREF